MNICHAPSTFSPSIVHCLTAVLRASCGHHTMSNSVAHLIVSVAGSGDVTAHSGMVARLARSLEAAQGPDTDEAVDHLSPERKSTW